MALHESTRNTNEHKKREKSFVIVINEGELDITNIQLTEI